MQKKATAIPSNLDLNVKSRQYCMVFDDIHSK